MSKRQSATDLEIIRFIQFICGLVLAILGIYMVGPWYVILPGSAAFGLLAEFAPLYSKVVAAGQAIAGIGTVYGAIWGNNKYTKALVWFAVSMYTMTVVTRLITVGFVPLVWVYQAGLLLITGALAIRVREH